MDESDFSARRVKGRRGRGVSGKAIVFGFYKRNDKVYAEIVPDCKNVTLQGSSSGASILKASFAQKESKSRFNQRGEKRYRILLKMFRNSPLF